MQPRDEQRLTHTPHSSRLLPGGTGIEWLDGQDISPHGLYDCIALFRINFSAVFLQPVFFYNI